MSRGTEELLRDLTVGSNKSFTVPITNRYRLLYAHCTLVTDNSGSARRIIMEVTKADNSRVFDTHAGATVAANVSTPQHHEFMQGVYRESSFIDNAIQVPFPKDCILLPGWKLVFKDENEQGVLVDTLVVNAVVDKLPA